MEGALQNVNLNRTLENVLAPSPGSYHQYLMMMLMMRWMVDLLETEDLRTVILHYVSLGYIEFIFMLRNIVLINTPLQLNE